MKNLISAVLVFMAVTVPPIDTNVQAGACPLSRGEAQRAISQQGLISAGAARQAAASRANGRVIGVILCKGGGQYYYKVNILPKAGGGKRLMSVQVNARTGASR